MHHPDDEFLVDLVFGPMWYWLLFGRRKLDVDYAGTLADAVCRVAGSEPGTTSSP